MEGMISLLEGLFINGLRICRYLGFDEYIRGDIYNMHKHVYAHMIVSKRVYYLETLLV
jgi:hypothetical protein